MHRFKVGDRVRVILSGDFNFDGDYVQQFLGATGTVIRLDTNGEGREWYDVDLGFQHQAVYDMHLEFELDITTTEYLENVVREKYAEFEKAMSDLDAHLAAKDA